MTEPRLIRCHLNSQIRWHAVPVDPEAAVEPVPYGGTTELSEDGAIEGLDPELWAMQLGFLFDRVYASEVGRVLIRAVRRGVTIYHGENNQTFPDTLNGAMPADMNRLAAESGAPAAMYLNLRRGPRRSVTGLPTSHEVSLVHELAHAVHITWGCYVSRPYSAADRLRFHSPSSEETGAWIIENMYRVERGISARATYLGEAPLPPGVLPGNRNTGVPLEAAERIAIDRLRQRARPVATSLAELPRRSCPYNPFR